MRTDLVGKNFGEWEVLSSHSTSRSGATRYICQCSCGTEKDVFASHLVSGKSKSCGCKIPKHKDRQQWTGYQDISGTQWAAIKSQARKTKTRQVLLFTITIEYMWELLKQQGFRCALSGVPISLSPRWKIPGSASVDRIDSSQGYVPGNVQWVHKDINLMKNRLNQDYFIKMCKQVAAQS